MLSEFWGHSSRHRGRPRAAREACHVPSFWKERVERSLVCGETRVGVAATHGARSRPVCAMLTAFAGWDGHCVAVPLCRHLLCDLGHVISPLWAVLVGLGCSNKVPPTMGLLSGPREERTMAA